MLTAKEARSKMEEKRTEFVNRQMQTIEQAFETQVELHCQKLSEGHDVKFAARIELEWPLASENKSSLEQLGYTVQEENVVEGGKIKNLIVIRC